MPSLFPPFSLLCTDRTCHSLFYIAVTVYHRQDIYNKQVYWLIVPEASNSGLKILISGEVLHASSSQGGRQEGKWDQRGPTWVHPSTWVKVDVKSLPQWFSTLWNRWSPEPEAGSLWGYSVWHHVQRFYVGSGTLNSSSSCLNGKHFMVEPPPQPQIHSLIRDPVSPPRMEPSRPNHHLRTYCSNDS